MSIDDAAERKYREELNRTWAKMRAKAKARIEAKEGGTRKQVTSRVQRAAGEALAALKRCQSEENQF